MFKVILWDVDNTLLDFTLAEKNSLKKGFEIFNLGECTDEMCEHYARINEKHWQLLEKGKIDRTETMVGRFRAFFEEEGIDFACAEQFNDIFENALKDTVVEIKNGISIVSSLKGKYLQFGVTNGAYDVQKSKLDESGLSKIFDNVYISEQVGAEKPSTEYFSFVLDGIKNADKSEILIVGDSLTSDMQGGYNIGIKTCWFNPKGKQNTKPFEPDFEIKSLNEIYEILK